MNDFERLLHGVLDGTNNFWDARYIGRACYAPITEDLRIKAEFQSTLVAAQYNALKLTAISNKKPSSCRAAAETFRNGLTASTSC